MRRRARAATTRTNNGRPLNSGLHLFHRYIRAVVRRPSPIPMRHLPLVAGAVLCLVVPMLAAEGQANNEQQTAQQPQRPGVQVGVPDGRAGGAGGGRQGGGRGRQAGPAGPAPRSADGRVLLGGATPKQRNGVWLPSGGGPVTEAN